ncbi:MAG: peptidoglycan-binding protein [Bosea sp. (in: a-proteobacteria)]
MSIDILIHTSRSRFQVPSLEVGMSTRQVRDLSHDLVCLGYLPEGAEQGIFDPELEAAVRRFQVTGIGANGRPLSVDGVVGAQTRFALDLALGIELEAPNTCLPPPPFESLSTNGNPLGLQALKLALEQIEEGAQEIGAPGGGPWCERYLSAAGLPVGSRWSTAFVAWCCGQTGVPDAAHLLLRAQELGWIRIGAMPQPGDLLIWTSEIKQSPPKVKCGHAAIVAGVAGGIVHTVEGERTPFVEFFHHAWKDLIPLVTVARPYSGRA